MRLLHFDALGKLVLTDFRGKTIPPYAILSHRWSDSEILIEDITSGVYKEKEEGYKKLKFCAEQAMRDELQYFWIDTCCIDRWNKAERSRTINSVFQWYKDATRCYVFLSDVSATRLAQQSDWEASFRASAWFTRAWTLQELIAPVSVEFFSCEGEYIGNKASLEQLIHDITSIPLDALRNCALDQFTVSERKQWVKDRATTEEEDIVYCLLGIIGVSMPTAYGEGQESASRRLQAEVEGASSAPSVIPFSRNEHFVGREVQLAEAEAKLFSNEQSTTTLAIVGSGGTGKSQLALEVAHQTKQNNKNCAIFWIDASEKDSIYQSYARVAQKLSILGWEDDQADMSQVIKHCVAELSQRQCLLIFDNADDTLLRSSSSSMAEAAPFANYLPQSKLCSVVFTTTNGNIAKALALQNVIELQELLPETAQRMLQNRLSRPLLSTEQPALNVLLRELLYLPMAVVQAAACMDASSMTVQEYQTRLGEHREVALESNSDSPQGKLLGSSVEDPVAATLFVSINEVHRTSAVAADYLFFAACVERRDISLGLLDAASVQMRENAIKVLDRYALITRRPAESALDLHRLVHDALRKWLQAQGQFRQYNKRAVTQLLKAFPSNDHSNRSKWRRLLPHAQCALSHSRTDDDNREGEEEEEEGERLELARKCAMTLYSDGRWEEAKELFVQVMETRKRALGEEHPSTLISMADLASTYRNQERWKEAEKLFVQVMETRKRVLGEEHPSTLISMANLASTYSDGRWEEAKELFVQVMETSSRVLGEEHPSTLTSMANLASTYRNQGRWKEAEELDVQVMDTRKRVLGEGHPSTLASMTNLASTYRNQGRWKEAEELDVQVMETSSSSMANLASTYRNQGRWKEAKELEVQVMEASSRVLGPEHPSTLTSMSNLSGVLESQGKFEEADLMHMRKLEGKEMTVLQDTGNEDGSQLLTLEPQVYDDFTTTSTLQGQSSIGVSQSETLAGEEQMSNQARDSLIDEMYDGDPLEASSVSSRVTTARDKDGKAHIAYFLATDSELRILCSGMMNKVDKAEFADTGRRLLKTFYLGLLEDAQTELQIQSVRLLKSRRSRVRISKDIVDIITSADAQDAKEKGEVMEQNRMRKERLENWAERYAHTPLDNKTSQLLEAEQHEQWTRKYPYEDHEDPWIQEDGGNQGEQEKRDEKHGTYSDAEPESEIENDENTLPNLTEMEAFFRNSESFQVLIYGFKKLLLPESLRDIVSSTSVELSNEEDESMLNYMKALVEDYTMLDWNWWPLESRMRPLNPDESRLIWHCVSKRKSWQCSRS
jgi:hypothetical protein